MDTISLKKYIYDNKKIEYILEQIGCKNIKYHVNKNFYSCSNYNGDNPNAINIKNNEYLNVRNWTRKGFEDNADIITLVEYNQNISFLEAIKYLHNLFDLEYKWQKKSNKKDKQLENKDPLYIFKKIRSKTYIDVADINILSDELLNDYIPILHIDWYREGIMPWTMKKFGLAYSYKQSRVIIPMRYWLTGELLGINKRTTIKNYNELGIKKFLLTPSYPKSINLYGLYENYEYIKKAGYVVVYEAEKSVLKRDSLGDSTGVALTGHSISDEQVRILIGLNVDIIISLDKDVPIEEIRYICEKFYGIRNIYYTFDKYDLLNEKDSIADKKNNIFNYFMKYKIKYDITEHQEYLKSLRGE